MSSTAGRAARYSSARFFSTVSSTRYATNSASSAEARLPYTVHRRPPKRRGWPSFAAAFFSSSPGITRPAGTRHASPPPSTSCEKASLYHTMLPPDTTTTGSARLAKVDCAFSPLPCKSFAMRLRRAFTFQNSKSPITASTGTTTSSSMGFTAASMPASTAHATPSVRMVRSTVQMRFFNVLPSPAPHTGGGPSHFQNDGQNHGAALGAPV